MAPRKSSRQTTRSPDGPDMEALRRHVRTKGSDYLADPNITSVGIGLKNGKGPVCIQFTVASKGESALETLVTTRIPDVIEVEGQAIPTDVVERTYQPSYKMVEAEQVDERRKRIDPIRPGVSVAHVAETAGTLGLVVFDRATGAACILSNWHVMHGNGGRIGDTIVQPGPFDDNNVALNKAGTLLRSHLGAAGDCALARISGRDFDRSVYGLDVVPKRMAQVELGDKVVKSGRTTAVTYGIVRRVDVMSKIDYDAPAGVQAIGGFEIGVDPDRPAADGEISMGGDSGSAWLIANGAKATDIFAGLHFAGEAGANTEEHALACYPLSVQKKLDFVLEPTISAVDGALPQATVPRSGYDAAFLGVAVPEPKLSTSLLRDAVDFGDEKTIPYTHFSVCLSKARKMARYVAWNVDGARLVKLPRVNFAIDPRIEAKYQTGNEAYSANKLDRGHIARRADLCWGPVAEARQANADSFYYTNIAPQHERYNQSARKGLWGELENLVFEQADVQNIKLSLMGGPIFSDDDITYRETRVPRAFWKLIAYRGGDDRLRCSAFILSQTDFLNDLESLDLDPFRLYQVDLPTLSQRTELDFSALKAADVALKPELATRSVGAGVEAVRRKREGLTEIGASRDLLF